MKEALDPPGYQRPVEGAGGDVKRALQELRDAIASGDKDRIRDALQKLKDAMNKYNGQAETLTAKKDDPRKRAILNDAIENLKDKVHQVRALQQHPEDKERIKQVMDSVDDSIDFFFDAAKRSKDDDMLKGVAIANNLFATLGALGDDDMDLGDLLNAAGQLGNLLRGLVQDTTGAARRLGANPEDLTEAAQAALELDELLCSLEGRPNPHPFSRPNIGKAPPLVSEEPIEVFTPAPDTHFTKIDLNTASTFEDVTAAVAYQIHEEARGISSAADLIAVELANLAAAARAGNRSDLLRAARAAAAHMNAYCAQLLALANKIPGNTPQERRLKEALYRSAGGLKDMATQLKILAAVKAASIENSKDADGTLISVTRNIGDMMKQGLTSMQICQSTLRLRAPAVKK